MTDETFKKIFRECLFDDLDEDITSPNFRFNIGGVDCVSSGSIVAVAGKPGVGKSTAIAIMAGVLLGGGEFGNMKCNKKVVQILWVDTEKDSYSCKQRTMTLRNVAGLDKDNKLANQCVQFLRFRNKSIKERFEWLEKYANGNKYAYDAIFIDGIFDLTADADKDFMPVIDLLKKLSDKGATVFAMLHTNKQAEDDNMRYALGTELQRICTNRFTVKYDRSKNCHNIIHDKSNDTRLAPTVSFRCDENGIAVPFAEVKTEDASAKKDSRTLANEEKIKSVLDGGIMMSRAELIQKLGEGEDGIKEETAVKAIQTAKNNGLISKENGRFGKYYLAEV